MMESERRTLVSSNIDLNQLDVRELKILDKAVVEQLLKASARAEAWLFYGMLVCALTVSALAIFLPVNALDRWPWLGVITYRAMAWFPFLAEYARYSEFPQVVSVVKVYAFFLWLPATLVGWVLFWGRRRVALAALMSGVRPRVIKPTSELVLLFGYVLAFFGMWLLPGDSSFMPGFTTANRFGLALVDGGGLFFLSMLPGVIALTFYLRLNSKHTQRR